jgi:capsular polysaccharide transport system ATP-binding protein
MIELRDVHKSYRTRQGRLTVLDGISFSLAPSEHLGILGQNGSGKSTLVRLISGAELPDSGAIDRSMSVSWPIAFGGGFQSSLTGLDNFRFICRIYGADAAACEPGLREFSELGKFLNEPIRTYSSGMRARLAFGISLAIEFDCFLIDEVVAVGDARFQEKCLHELFEKRRDRAMVIVSHQPHFITQYCDRAAVLHGGKLTAFPNVPEAYAHYESVTHQP